MNEYEIYADAIDILENRIADDDKYPVAEDRKIKNCCKVASECAKFLINYIHVVKEKGK